MKTANSDLNQTIQASFSQWKTRLAHLSTRTRMQLVFWIGLPLIWVVPTIFYSSDLRFDSEIPYYYQAIIVYMFVMWGCSYAVTLALARLPVLRNLKPVVLILFGGLIGILVFARVLLRAMTLWRASLAPNSAELLSELDAMLPSMFQFSPEVLAGLLSVYWFRIFCWTISAWFFYTYFRVPSFGIYEQKVPAGRTKQQLSDSAEPHFLAKTNPSIGKDIIALKAEGHFIRVYTIRGDDLIHYKFGDAVEQLSSMPGAQVHRSFWIRTENAKVVKTEAGKLEVHLSNGLIVPVGHTYKQHLKALGLIPH